MKNIKYSLCIIITLIATSCSKEFINRPPLSAASVDALYKTDKDFLDATIGVYQGLRVQYQNMWQFGDIRGDDGFIQVTNQPSTTAVDLFSINSADALLNSTWSNYYVVISRANILLAKIAEADPNIVKNKDLYIGEAKFLRALAYFDLVRIFGNVPLITKVLTLEEIQKTGRTPVATVYNEVIIKDLIDAASKLPVAFTGSAIGRATKGAAKAILGKVYMTTKDFPKAEIELKELTAAPYKYNLLTNFNDLFDFSKDEHHSEYIFDIEHEENLGGQGSVFTNFFMPNVAALLNYYGIKGGFNESLATTAGFRSIWSLTDKRKNVTFTCCGEWTNPTTGAVVKFNSTTSQSFTSKYLTSVPAGGDSKANWKVTRYADVLLMLAEALNENGKTDLALVEINKVRLRAGMAVYAGLTKEKMRENVALERRLELTFEGHRWFDLVRTGKALEACAAVGMKDYMSIFPVPLSQVNVMNDATLFPQNPGYN